MVRKRRKFTARDKVLILKRHLLEKAAVSDLCEEYGIQPTVFYRWQKQFFENGESAFERSSRKKSDAETQRIEFLEAKLKKKNEVLSELMEEHVALKKELGEL
jgi:transposase-like protein